VIPISLRELLDKFAVGFSVLGIFVQTHQELFPIVQESQKFFLALKRTARVDEGISNIEIDNQDFGLLADSLSEDLKILIIANKQNINEIQTHWKRFSPVLREKAQLEDFILQESMETRIINRLEDIRILLSKSAIILKEKTEDVG
jgi:hypothetical protein